MQISQEQYNKLPERLQKHFSKGNTHPTIKNVKLMEYLIKMASKEGDLILDPFAGSCTTLLACKQLKRRCICIEKEADYIRICNERLERSTNSLF